MANLSIPAPVETEKAAFLHDRSNRPAAPSTPRSDLLKRWAGTITGIALAIGFTALLFSVRDSWENHREWLVTVIPILAIGAIAAGHLLARKQGEPLAAGIGFLLLAAIFAAADIMVDREAEPSATTQDVLSVLGGVCLGLAALSLVVALFWVELRNPTKAPEPEL
jgi:peptidoglycan/LPS O-acetylase OafA/YrhL